MYYIEQNIPQKQAFVKKKTICLWLWEVAAGRRAFYNQIT